MATSFNSGMEIFPSGRTTADGTEADCSPQTEICTTSPAPMKYSSSGAVLAAAAGASPRPTGSFTIRGGSAGSVAAADGDGLSFGAGFRVSVVFALAAV